MDPSRQSGPVSAQGSIAGAHSAQTQAQTHAGAEPPAGIYCANPDCRTRAGERSRGHQSCRALLCGHCCQNAARAAAEAGEQRPICKVHARRVHTGHKPALKPEQRSADASSASMSNTGGVSAPSSSPPSAIGSRSVGEPEELHDLLDKRARLEQSLKRSLTMVIWYRVSIFYRNKNTEFIIFSSIF